MKITRTTGETCVGEVRLAPIDAGFDVRLHKMMVIIPEDAASAGYEQDGDTWLVEGTREEIVRVLTGAGYTVRGAEAAAEI